jgi:Alkylated DNA repair protein
VKEGDVLVMGGNCQSTHNHSVPKPRKREPKEDRISFTFRCFAGM